MEFGVRLRPDGKFDCANSCLMRIPLFLVFIEKYTHSDEVVIKKEKRIQRTMRFFRTNYFIGVNIENNSR